MTPAQISRIIHQSSVASGKLDFESVEYLVKHYAFTYRLTEEGQAEVWGLLSDLGYTTPRDPSADDGTDGRPNSLSCFF